MTFSTEWNTAYSNGQRRQQGMSAMLVSLFALAIGDLRGQHVLELGCGVGSNAADLVAAGAEYWGCDGSRTAIQESLYDENRTHVGAHFVTCDFTAKRPWDGISFDIVFDRASVSHNSTEGIERAIGNAWEALKPGGIYIGNDWFSTNHSEFLRGQIVDLRTRTAYPDGQFVAVGNVHFTDEAGIRDLFSAFETVGITERVTRHLVPRQRVRWQSSAFDGGEYRSAVWDIVMRKPR